MGCKAWFAKMIYEHCWAVSFQLSKNPNVSKQNQMTQNFKFDSKLKTTVEGNEGLFNSKIDTLRNGWGK